MSRRVAERMMEAIEEDDALNKAPNQKFTFVPTPVYFPVVLEKGEKGLYHAKVDGTGIVLTLHSPAELQQELQAIVHLLLQLKQELRDKDGNETRNGEATE